MVCTSVVNLLQVHYVNIIIKRTIENFVSLRFCGYVDAIPINTKICI